LNKMNIAETIFINLPQEEIFTYICNLENLADWSGAIISARKISSEDMLVGTTVRFTIRILGRWFDTTYEIVECVPNHYFTIKSISSIAPSLVRYQFEPVEKHGTKVTVEENITFPGGFLGFAEPVIKGAIRRQIVNDLQTLKELLETTDSLYSNTG
jgi:uncharacterized membrane protein